MDIERVESLAQGRVYSGLGALKVGLIDSIGGIDDAIQIAKELAEIPDNTNVTITEYPKPKFLDKLLDQIFSAKTNALTKNAVNTPADLFFLAPYFSTPSRGNAFMEDLLYRIEHNGQVMPILPLSF